MKMTRKEFLTTAAIAAIGATSNACAGLSATRPGRPNFVIVLCDDLGYGDLSCYGNPIIDTPRLDRLASEGLRLTDCYAAAPVCSPSRAGMLTGRNPYRCNIPDWIPPGSPIHLQRNEITVAGLLRDAGYRSCHSGKWHCSGTMDGSQPTPGDHGFGHWFSTQNNAHPSHRNPDNFVRNGVPAGPLEGYSSTLIVDEAIRFLDTTRGDPFLLFVWFHSPHEPIATAPEFQDRCAREPDAAKRIYYGNVTQMDFEVGRLMDALDARGLRENTFVMFTSDNGPETLNRYKGAELSHGSPGPLRGMKLHLHEGGIRVPGILRWPGHIGAKGTSGEPLNGADVLPTLCAMAGVDVPDDRPIDGADFSPLLRGQAVRRGRPLYWRYDRALSAAKIAMRQGDWKILADGSLGAVELYNLREDLGENRNLADAEPKRVAQMTDALRSIHQEITRESEALGGVPS
ncbi:MAG: sulfatase-like hydrolase/transferase [Candidatus Hydrogenedentes bacterium]|nr:sulfatase-like hydrolase/transferase [Candidatus Hydrogenedentota bacterium]